MSRARKPWTKTVEVSGVAVRLYERADRGGVIYREARLGGGAKDRQSLHTSDRAHAVQLLEALAIAAGVLPEAERVACRSLSSAASTRPCDVRVKSRSTGAASPIRPCPYSRIDTTRGCARLA